jgi:hypothetical protein
MSNEYISIAQAARVYQMLYKTGGKGKKKCREALFAELDKVLGEIGTCKFYIGMTGDDNASGRTWRESKRTLGGLQSEDMFAGDEVYFGIGLYKELICSTKETIQIR